MKDLQSSESIEQRQARFNRSTRTHWRDFATHRKRVQEMILTGRTQMGARFCALGAGNCNDLELPRLLEAFEQVHLVDIDSAALSAAVDRQGVKGSANLWPHAPVDLTGIVNVVSGWKNRVPSVTDVRQATVLSVTTPLPEFDGPFDFVLSSCLLSQLVGYATDGLEGDRHPGFQELVQAIRARHLRLMLSLLAPGGTGLLICDLVSSDSLPELRNIPEHELPGLLTKLAREGNFFSGLFPNAVAAALQNEPTAVGHHIEFRLLPPWLWRLGPERTFLVYALRFRIDRAGLILA